MTWFKVDDKLAESPKIRGAGLAGLGLWLMAGVKCASRNTDGYVDPLTAKDAAYLADVDDHAAAAAQLVSVGLWHDHKTIRRCDRCSEVTASRKLEAGWFYFHDWNEYQLDKASQSSDEAKRKDARRRRLHRDKTLIGLIRDRDGTLCRYCGIRVDFEDRKSPKGGCYDHVDPDGPNTLENVVVSCRGCNTEKAERTPEEAGMQLLPPGTLALSLFRPGSDRGSERDLTGSDTDLIPDLTGGQNGSNPGSDISDPKAPVSDPGSDLAGAHARLGTGSDPGRNGSDPRSDFGSDRHGPDQAAAGSDGSGPGLGQAVSDGEPA